MELPSLYLCITSAKNLFSLPHPSPINVKQRLAGTAVLPPWSPVTFEGQVIHLPVGDFAFCRWSMKYCP